ncbi:hypothetical protein AGRHK599_LOCUS3603 [Rhizobium rhizogenes]|uniref:Uncharacterized protein n=1 Tax=Rhizobium rhizogenes TaxID=359 RepID=A0AAN2DF14_RHIRH|nr:MULTISPECIES: hypothetical protein [Rhizobium/Agrobacterium group]MCZ7441667.1 hypothetical protein [Rhizobium rhizogenes]CAD0215358.1 hypothetical protein AGRHK599_LOCUS3603 [Rhizobium rhizogenes]
MRRVETADGDAWQAMPATRESQKKENFSITRFGEEAAKSMAITRRRKWLKALPVTYLAYGAITPRKWPPSIWPRTHTR